MFEQDYVMRLIKEMVRAVLKMLFHIDTDSPTDELLRESEEKETLKTLLDLVEQGKINQAENSLYEFTSQGSMSGLKIALLFYSYLNDKTDDFLGQNDFSREEIKEGLNDMISQYGVDGITDMFM